MLRAGGWRFRHRPRASKTDAWLEERSGALLVTWGREFPLLRRTPPDFPLLDPNSEFSRPQSAGSMLSLAIAEGVTAPLTAPITWPLDAIQVLAGHATEPNFWNAVTAECASTGYGPVVAAGLEWLRSQIGADVPKSVVEILTAGAMDATVMREIDSRGASSRLKAASRRRVDIRRARCVEPWSAVPAVSPWSSGLRFLQASSAARILR